MSSSTNNCRITIIGAGVIGLTTACTILKEYAANENLQLTIISEKFSPNTTGDVSAGYWEPYGFANMDDRIMRWSKYTYDVLVSESFSTKASRAGIMFMPSFRLFGYNGSKVEGDEEEKPKFLSVARHYHMLDKNELKTFDNLKPVSGFMMLSVAVQVNKYLPLLLRYLSEDSRVRFVKKKVHSLVELKDTADVVINCSGLAARELVGDQTVRPARGQVIRVHAPWIKAVYSFDTDEGFGYAVPQGDCVVLGGTFQLNDWNTKPNESDTQKILRMCRKALPGLEHVRRGKVRAGLRPYRDNGVRLEHEKTSDGINVVHCYGHSGAGVTLSWGCAKDVVNIIKKLLPANPVKDNNLPEHEKLWRLAPTNIEYIVIRAKI